eukprot:677462-Prorocentrum_minimum.AAC.3
MARHKTSARDCELEASDTAAICAAEQSTGQSTSHFTVERETICTLEESDIFSHNPTIVLHDTNARARVRCRRVEERFGSGIPTPEMARFNF